jgi:hypothetical protein
MAARSRSGSPWASHASARSSVWTAPGAEPWDIAIGAPNWWRTPISTAVAFISDWTGYVVDVAERRVLVEVPGVVRVRQDAHHDLILLITQTSLTAVGAAGVAWTSPELASGDLKVVAIDAGAIHCTGSGGGYLPSAFTVDPVTGRP